MWTGTIFQISMLQSPKVTAFEQSNSSKYLSPRNVYFQCTPRNRVDLLLRRIIFMFDSLCVIDAGDAKEQSLQPESEQRQQSYRFLAPT